jgi:hypothetical protein
MKNIKHICLLVTCLTVALGFAQEHKEVEPKTETVSKDLSKDIHLIAEASQDQVSVDGELNIEYRLYVSHNIGITGWDIIENPTYDGFDYKNVKFENLKIENVTYKGEPYRMVILKRDILKATKSGDFKVMPLQLKITAEVAADTTKEIEKLKPSLKEVTTTLVSNAIEVNVKS